MMSDIDPYDHKYTQVLHMYINSQSSVGYIHNTLFGINTHPKDSRTKSDSRSSWVFTLSLPPKTHALKRTY